MVANAQTDLPSSTPRSHLTSSSLMPRRRDIPPTCALFWKSRSLAQTRVFCARAASFWPTMPCAGAWLLMIATAILGQWARKLGIKKRAMLIFPSRRCENTMTSHSRRRDWMLS